MTARATLIILGHPIGTSADDLNLTDMWRAAGSDATRRPVEWQRSAQGTAFIDFIAGNLKVENSHLLRTEKGRSGATWGHWQIGLAYAQYLSPRFHAACNSIVRAYMEGRGTQRQISARDMNAFSRAGTLILRTLGPRAAVRPITDMARQLGLDVDADQAESLRQAELNLDKEPATSTDEDNVVDFTA